MNANKSTIAVLMLSTLAGGAMAAQDWQAQGVMAAEQLAAEHEYRWQQQSRQQAQRRAAEEARREQQQYRWQQRSQQRHEISVFASNVAGPSKLYGKGAR